jgi:NodT family efflux transporter outer membrane factor (OMF) lipoprotein
LNAGPLRARAALVVALLGGCAVGPDFEPPAPPEVERYTPGPAPRAATMPALDESRPVPVDWWTVFGSADLDALVRAALAGSPTLAQARAHLAQAQELLAARRGATELPQADAVFGAVRQRIDPATFGFPQAPNPGPFNVFSLGADVSYDFDLFGGTRRELESLGAEVDVQRFEFDAARLVLTGNVVLTVLRIAELEARDEALDTALSAERQQLAIVEGRHAAGAVSLLDLQQQREALADAEAALPVLRSQRAQAVHLLAVLAGRAPADALPPLPRLADLRPPPDVPLRLPSALARERPDIRASEALLHKANALVGVAVADQYPKFVVSGSFSAAQLALPDLFSNGINVWSFGLNIVQPLLRGPELQARKRAAEAAHVQAAAAYRAAVLHGLQEVADALRALEGSALVFERRTEQLARADAAWRIVRGRFDAGGASRLALLDAERRLSQARADWVQAQASRCADVATLLQALGGGVLDATVALR